MSDQITKRKRNTQDISKTKTHPKVLFDKETTQRVEGPTANPWGLDLTDPNRIKRLYEGIEITIIGCVLTEVQHSCRVT